MTYPNMASIFYYPRCSLVLCFLLSFFMTSAQAQNNSAALGKSTRPTESRGSYLVSVPGGGRAAPDIARILNRGELIVALVAIDTPPFFSEKNGVMEGIDIDLVNEIAAELKVPVRYDRSAKTFNEVVEVVADGKADFGISKLARTLSRAKMVSYTIPYMSIKHAWLVNRLAFAKLAKDRPAPQVVREFNGTIGVLEGRAWEDFALKNFPKAQMVRFKTWEEAVEAVKQGKIVATYRDEFEVNTVFKEDPKLTLTLRTITFNDLESSLAMPVGINDRALLGFLNEFIFLRAEKPSMDAIMKAMK